MKMYDQTIRFEKVALSIFHEVKTYLPPQVLWDYLQRRHSTYLKRQNITSAMRSNGQSDAAEIWTNEDESAEIERQIIDDARR